MFPDHRQGTSSSEVLTHMPTATRFTHGTSRPESCLYLVQSPASSVISPSLAFLTYRLWNCFLNGLPAPSVFPYSVCPNAPNPLYSRPFSKDNLRQPFNTHEIQTGLHICPGMVLLPQDPARRLPTTFLQGLSQNVAVCMADQELVCTGYTLSPVLSHSLQDL